MKNWRCTVCGYIHKGDMPPEKCPNCGSPSEKFVEHTQEVNVSEVTHMHYGQMVTYGEERQTNPFFEDFESLAPFIYNLPVGTNAPLHKHPTTDELFFVLRGKLRFKIGEKEFVAEKGDMLKGKMNIPHTFANIGDEPAVFLSVKGPKPVDVEVLEK
ncbi:MAG: hypothetical protein K0Q99_616 [Clostridia bacterium]|nr:hypothetical protein [Clostridia bacterium]